MNFLYDWISSFFKELTSTEDNFEYKWQRAAFKKAISKGLQEDQIKEISEFSRDQSETFSAGANFENAKEIKNVYQRSAFVETGLPINLALKFANHPDQHMALFSLKYKKFASMDTLLKLHTPLIESIIEQCADRTNCIDITNFIRSSDSLDELSKKMSGLSDLQSHEDL